MEVATVAAFIASFVVVAICALFCCSVSHDELQQDLCSDDVPFGEFLPSYPGPIDHTGQYPFPPPPDPNMIPPELMNDPGKFPSVTQAITSEFVYQE
jgi:hypothetical protein